MKTFVKELLMSSSMTQETRGMWLGAIGVAISLTLPFTRMTVAELNPVLVALGQAVVAVGHWMMIKR